MLIFSLPQVNGLHRECVVKCIENSMLCTGIASDGHSCLCNFQVHLLFLFLLCSLSVLRKSMTCILCDAMHAVAKKLDSTTVSSHFRDRYPARPLSHAI